MKKYTFLLLISISLLKTAATQEKTVDAVVNKAFTAIKNNDEQAFMKLFPTYPQLKSLFSELASQITDSIMREGFNQGTAQLTEDLYNTELKGNTIKTFQEVVARGREMGIDWTRAIMDSFMAVEHHEPGFEVKAMMGNIYISENDKQFFIPFSEIIWSKQYQGWFGFKIITILKKGQSLEDLSENALLFDTTMAVADTVMYEAPSTVENKKQPIKKPGNKKPVTKKPEAKQPAKKPSNTAKPTKPATKS